MKHLSSLCLFTIYLLLFYFVNSTHKFKTESENLLWKSVVNNFLKAPGAFESKETIPAKSNEENNIDSEVDEYHSENESEVLNDTFNPKVKNKQKVSTKDKGSKIFIEGWLTIGSSEFKNQQRFPLLPLPDGSTSKIELDQFNRRINGKFDATSKKGSNPPGENYFWFRLSEKYLYYTNFKSEMNILGSLLISKVEEAQEFVNADTKEEVKAYCFKIIDSNAAEWKLCSPEEALKNKWVCWIKASLGLIETEECKGGKKVNDNKKSTNAPKQKVDIQQETQTMIIIPEPSRFCNQKWNYNNKGNDWECNCKEGQEQSPIDLPEGKIAVSSAVRPLFEYQRIEPIATENSPNGFYKTGEHIKIVYHNNSLRIFHQNLGKIITVNGTGYVAQEIVFHTPSEHTINGERFDMEMQVIHNARTKGDIGKKAVLSFLFKGKPGVYNKFLEQLDYFDLPNPLEKRKDIFNNLYIPNAFYESTDDDAYLTPNFSFYTYEGSLTEPPCTENTIHYIVSQPILASITTLQLFKEALNTPDQEDANGNLIITENASADNYRNAQLLNGRTVFYYDSNEYGSPEFILKKSKPASEVKTGHYEKREKTITEYMFVNGESPSGLPNSFVVPEEEAKGNESAI